MAWSKKHKNADGEFALSLAEEDLNRCLQEIPRQTKQSKRVRRSERVSDCETDR